MFQVISTNSVNIITCRATRAHQLIRDVFKISCNFATKSNSTLTENVPKTKFKFDQAQFKKGQRQISPYGWFMLAIPVTAFGLGCWQIQRKIWKEKLIEELAAQINSEAVNLPDDFSKLDSMEYRPVRVRGKFLHNRELIMGPRSLLKPDETISDGIFTQQNASIGNIILINRGWVSKDNINPNNRLEGQIQGTVELIGVVRKSENRPQFSPKHTGEIFLYRDVPLMCELSGADPVYLDAKTSVKGGPIGNQTRIQLRNEHLSYITTWFTLSGVTSYLWHRRIFKGLQLR